MLVKWEQNDPEVRALWKKMNDWVYAGFDETYKMMGVSFDKIYYESDTYLEGKEKVMEGLELSIATHLIAFWDGKSSGTKHMIDIAQEKGIPIWVFNY